MFICHLLPSISWLFLLIGNCFCLLQHLAELLLHTILNKLKTEKTSLEHSFTHALCRVYIGICRQLGDLERARLFCYSLLKEGMVWFGLAILFFKGGVRLFVLDFILPSCCICICTFVQECSYPYSFCL